MFGETELIGLKKVKLSENGLLTLPNFTNAESNEHLIFYSPKNDIRLYSEQIIDDKAKKIFDALKTKLTFKEYDAYVRIFYAILLSEETVKKNGKITIPPKVRQHLNSTIYIRGCIDHLRFFNTLEDVKKYELTLK